MPPGFALDRQGFVFCSFALAVASWAVLDTQRFFRILGSKTTLTRFQVMVVRVPGTIVIVVLIWLLAGTLIQKG